RTYIPLVGPRRPGVCPVALRRRSRRGFAGHALASARSRARRRMAGRTCRSAAAPFDSMQKPAPGRPGRWCMVKYMFLLYGTSETLPEPGTGEFARMRADGDAAADALS